jgi:hypothetical protein
MKNSPAIRPPSWTATLSNPANDSLAATVFRSSAVTGVAMGAAQQGFQWLQGEWKERRSWQVSVTGDDDLYFLVHEWLMNHGDTKKRRALLAKTTYKYNPHGRNTPELRLLVDDDSAQKIDVFGETITVFVEDESGQHAIKNTNSGPEPVGSNYSAKPPRLVFKARGQSGRDAVLRLLEELDDQRRRESRVPGLMILDRWGSWTRHDDLPPRPMDSVIVKGNVLQELHDDLATFMAREHDYVRRAIPYHRCYLLEGPPGTGKTSTVKAITNALGLDLWYAQLSGIDKDTRLTNLLSEVKAQGVLLLEDIDSLPAAVDRSDERAAEGDVSTSGLLNALDGVTTPHGLITIMTTNFPETLDPALLRPGRVDRTFSFEYPDSRTIHRHFEFFYGRYASYRGDWPLGRSSSAISELFKQHMDDPYAAETALLRSPADLEEATA